MALTDRIGLIIRPVSETWMTLPEEDQEEWRQFFADYLEKVVQKQELDGGALAQIWSLAHDYYRAYGPLWD